MKQNEVEVEEEEVMEDKAEQTLSSNMKSQRVRALHS